MNADLPARKFPAHPTPVRRHNQPVVLFVTSRLADVSLTLTRKDMQDAWCKFWKGRMRRILALDHTIWQRDCWDTQMRDADHYAEKRSYVGP